MFSYRKISNTLFKYPIRNQSTLGFIGLGNMGLNMSLNLIKKGHKLVVYDIFKDAVNNLTKLGAISASSPAEVASNCDKIITMLPSNPHVLEVYLGKNGILSSVQKGSLLVDSSTVSPTTSQKVHAETELKSADFIDAPVSGAVPAARDATLTFMVGGKAELVEKIKDVLLCMGKNVINTGPVGTGVSAKICNNMMLAISMIGTSETLNLAKRLGLDPKMMTQILNVSSGRSWTSEIYNPVPGINPNVPSSKNYEGGFQTQLMTKDLNLAQSSANQTNTPTPLGSLCYQIYQTMLNNGYFGKDFSSVYKFLEEKK